MAIADKFRGDLMQPIALLFVIAVMNSACTTDRQPKLLDCPHRDVPFSLNSPLMDILPSESATAVVQQNMPQLVTLPEFMTSTQAPAFGAIVTM
jgi:hypothetical protein